jgi:hypothetical protein
MWNGLVPVNALIALSTMGDIYPSTLADAGYHVAGIEVPVATDTGKVVIDVALFRSDRNRFLAGESKSGANIEKEQARQYGELNSDAVVAAAAVTIRAEGDRELQPLYICQTEHVSRILKGLSEAGLECPVLGVDNDRIEHHGAEFDDPDLQAAFDEPITAPGPPLGPRSLPCPP